MNTQTATKTRKVIEWILMIFKEWCLFAKAELVRFCRGQAYGLWNILHHFTIFTLATYKDTIFDILKLNLLKRTWNIGSIVKYSRYFHYVRYGGG